MAFKYSESVNHFKSNTIKQDKPLEKQLRACKAHTSHVFKERYTFGYTINITTPEKSIQSLRKNRTDNKYGYMKSRIDEQP